MRPLHCDVDLRPRSDHFQYREEPTSAATFGINGFGRIGRLGLRVAWRSEELELAHVNEIAGDAACSAHLQGLPPPPFSISPPYRG